MGAREREGGREGGREGEREGVGGREGGRERGGGREGEGVKTGKEEQRGSDATVHITQSRSQLCDRTPSTGMGTHPLTHWPQLPPPPPPMATSLPTSPVATHPYMERRGREHLL